MRQFEQSGRGDAVTTRLAREFGASADLAGEAVTGRRPFDPWPKCGSRLTRIGLDRLREHTRRTVEVGGLPVIEGCVSRLRVAAAPKVRYHAGQRTTPFSETRSRVGAGREAEQPDAHRKRKEGEIMAKGKGAQKRETKKPKKGSKKK